MNAAGKKVAFTQFRYINPMPTNAEEVLRKYKNVIVAELNTGQFADYLQSKVSGLVVKRIYKPEFGISDCRFSCYARFPIGAYYICPPNNMDGKMQNCKVQMKFTL